MKKSRQLINQMNQINRINYIGLHPLLLPLHGRDNYHFNPLPIALNPKLKRSQRDEKE